MAISYHQDSPADLTSLEAAVADTRAGFACMFSTSDEFEDALVSVRRAEGRYGSTVNWQALMLVGCVLVLTGVLLVAIS